MAQVRRRLPPPRIRNWKTVFNRHPLSRRNSTDNLSISSSGEHVQEEPSNDAEAIRGLQDVAPIDAFPNFCDPDLELLPPVISQSPFPKRTTIMQNVKLFEESVSPDSFDIFDGQCLQKKCQRENKSLDLNLQPQLSTAKKVLWSSSSAIPGRASCDSPPLISEPRPRSIMVQPGALNRTQSSSALILPESATFTVDHRLPDHSSEQYCMLQSVTDSAFIEAVEDPSGTNTSIQIFPSRFPNPGIQFQEHAPAVDRFLLAHQIRRISSHRSKMQSNLDADRQLCSDQILSAFKEGKAMCESEEGSRTASHTDRSDHDVFEYLSKVSPSSVSGKDSDHDVQCDYDEGQPESNETVRSCPPDAPEIEIIYKATRKGVFMDISNSDEGKPSGPRQTSFLRRKSRLPRHTYKPSPSLRPDLRLLPRSNRTLIRNAIVRVCLAGGATESERARALEALDSCISEWIVILLRQQRHKFRGLYRVESEDDNQILIRIFGDGPLQIPTCSVDSFLKYDSANKCFDLLPTRHLTATTDAVSISKRFGTRPGRTT